MLVPKTALETPPLEIHTLGDEVLRQPARRTARRGAAARARVARLAAREALVTLGTAVDADESARDIVAGLCGELLLRECLLALSLIHI